MAYIIVRYYRDLSHPDHQKIIKTGLTLEEAQEHCNDESTQEPGVWFDGYCEIKPRKKPGLLEQAAKLLYLEKKGIV